MSLEEKAPDSSVIIESWLDWPMFGELIAQPVRAVIEIVSNAVIAIKFFRKSFTYL